MKEYDIYFTVFIGMFASNFFCNIYIYPKPQNLYKVIMIISAYIYSEFFFDTYLVITLKYYLSLGIADENIDPFGFYLLCCNHYSDSRQ